MKRYRVPAEYRRAWIALPERRLKRSFGISGGLGAVLLVLLLLVPVHRPVHRPERILPRERSTRLLSPSEPPRRVVTPEAPKPVPPSPVSKPQAVARPQSKPAPKPVPRPASPEPRQAAAGPSGRAGSAAPSGGGEKGRAEGARVAREVERTTATIDNLLSSLTGTVNAPGGVLPSNSGAGGAGGGKRSNAKHTVVGGRGSGGLASTDVALRGSGAGEVGAGSGGGGRGVERTGVAIASEGVDTAGDGVASSGRDSRSLMATVQRYVAGIKFCYDNSLKKSPQLEGKITLQMDIAASGAVRDLEPLDDGIGNAALQKCILSQVSAWRFPAIESGVVRFTLPLVLTPPQTSAP